MFPKPRRAISEDVLDAARASACVACGSIHLVHAHHVTSIGAGGGDTVDNVMPLCQTHHNYWHHKGAVDSCRKFPGIKRWLEYHGRLLVLERALSKRGNHGS